MKVLHLSSSYPFTDLYKNLLKAIDHHEIKQIMYVPFEKDTLNDTRIINNSYGVEYLFSQPFQKIDRYIYYSKISKIYNELLYKINLKEVDHVHAHFLFSDGGVAYKIKKNYNIDYTVAVRNADVNFFFKYGFHIRHYGVKILNEAKNIVFISPAYKEFFIENYIPEKYKNNIRNKSFVIPNGIDKYWLNNLNHSKIINDKSSINIIYVGELNHNKNVITSIHAISILKKKKYNIKFNIVGEGNYKTEILNEIKRHDLSNDIVLHGFISDKTKLTELYRDADMYLMPSYKETFGLVYIEAMSQGLPVLYSKGQGIDGYFEDGVVGYPVLSYEPNDIANKIESILLDYELISKNALKEAKKFEWEKIAIQYLSMYKE